MISNALRTDIEVWASRVRQQNPLFEKARNGTITHSMVTRYIANVTYMVRFTPGHLKRARDGARRLGDEVLALHYEHKLREEAGHALWGEADLEVLTELGRRPENTTATPAIERLATYLEGAIEADPANYLPYLALTEYVTVLLGPQLMELIERATGVGPSSMTIIDKHIELDREHSEEGFGCIDDLVADPRKCGPLRKALAEMLAHFDEFAVEVTTEVVPDSVRTAHVSAA